MLVKIILKFILFAYFKSFFIVSFVFTEMKVLVIKNMIEIVLLGRYFGLDCKVYRQLTSCYSDLI